MPTLMARGMAPINSIDVTINQGLKALKPKSQIDTRYLLYAVLSRAKEVQSHGKGVTVQGITIERLRPIKMPPPLEKQWRIMAILDECNDIEMANRRRRETLDGFDDSYFRHLFGEPSIASKSWPLETIASCSTTIQAGPFGSLLH